MAEHSLMTFLGMFLECVMATCESGIHYPVDNPLCVHQPILVAGALTDEWFGLLIEVSPIHSDKVIKALRDHLVDGDSRKMVCERHRVNAGYLSICMGRLFHINQVVCRLSSYYCENK
ncbi:adhesin biosynthesis transcription regulatory family protein [Edwardsiella tarda]|uniref:PapB/FocB family fimbrial expression transcriptional regulator n=1 Tax=Edwardsiella tarda TaxID=636 RepID=UPI00266F76D5|nr:PapB/FocB family fimbrial expression transcriptional regulator [Edwardsiella tarda]WKS81836.1 adhesin biosynthesis transcription regulatory family protein [Edwardsiella tarda]